MRTRFLAAAVLLMPAFAAGETILLRSGKTVSGKILSASANYVTILKSDPQAKRRQVKLSVAQIAEIGFNGRKVGSAQDSQPARPLPPEPKNQPTEADRQRGAELFASATTYAQKWPDAAALVLYETGKYSYHADGTWTMRYRFAAQILKETAMGDMAIFNEYQEDGRERVKILKATVYRPDGKIILYNPANLRDTSPQEEDDMYADAGTLSYAMPLLCPGAIIEYEAERETYNPFRKDFFFPEWEFQSSWPVQESSLEVTVPKNIPFYHSAVGFTGALADSGDPKVTETENERSYRWKLSDVAPAPLEPSMPPKGDTSPRIKGALFKEWDRVYDWLSGMYDERIKPDAELVKLSADITRNAKTDEEKAAAIYDFVQANVRYIAVKMGIASSWGGYSASTTWHRRYGCCIDKAILMCSLLQAQKIACSPVLLDTNLTRRHDMSLPDIEFEHALVWARVGDKEIFLDPTAYDFRYPAMDAMDYGVEALNIFNRRVDYIPNVKPRENSSAYNYDITLSTSGTALVRFASEYSGPREGELRELYRSSEPEDRAQMLSEWIGETAPGAVLGDWKLSDPSDLSRPLSITLDYSMDASAWRAGGLTILALPDFEITSDETALDSRSSDVVYPAPYGKYYHYAITLPPGAEPASLPVHTEIANPNGAFSLACRWKAPQLVCDGSMEVASRVVAVSDYPAFKTFIENAARASREKIFIKEAAR
jgi:transglutaminase-like putative cysteine protease